ncbi:MAG TPA: RagB/SusD family nutrient uptake outer membrane protein, partial [Porphyromonadaceae bacterium]|nr:RagB/SusD family nutrient uptake outer membrane protein [Porphyromonadaceae bacterium]
YYHMKLLLNWEKIILREEYINSPDQLDVPLSERSVCWESIIRDLKQATKLPVKQTSAHTGRATSGAAWA